MGTARKRIDAYLWVKIPGTADWFPEQALQLAQLANPPLNTHH